MGIKERRTKILLAFLLLSDKDFTDVELTASIASIFDLSLNKKTASTLKKMSKEGFLTDKGLSDTGSPIYRLTDLGFDDVSLQFPFFRYQRHEWDNKWRILSYEIPEKKRELRDKLRREVAGWGLGPWHRSFWITPHPIIPSLQALVSKKEEEQYIQAFESSHVFGDREILIEKVWQKAKREQTYKKVFKKWHDILSTDQDKDKKFSAVINEYISVLRDDPGLPKEVMGDNWIGFEAFTLFKEIRKILLGR
ncbi:MAG: PaaX family transcriptional regulator C-terminal domain-containing protein [Weeksellaceae bacterium]